MIRPATRVAAAVAAGFLMSSGAHAALFLNLDIKTGTTATAQVGAASGNVTDTDLETTSFTTLPTTSVGHSTSSQAVKTVAGQPSRYVQSNATSTVTAYYNTADFVSFDASSSTSINQTVATSGTRTVAGTAQSGLYEIAYQFHVIKPTKEFKINYATSALSPPAGVGDATIKLLDAANNVVFNFSIGHQTSGVIDEIISNGDYKLVISSPYETYSYHSSTASNSSVSSFGTTDHYDLFLLDVPEASTWALMILGFGMVGGALRRPKLRPVLKYS